MPRAHFSLDQLRIETPCPVDLDRMPGDDRTRFCTQCNLHVTNVSLMKRADAEAFIASRADGRTCVQLFRHADGKVAAADDSLPRRFSSWLSRRAMRTAAAIGISTLLINALGCWGGGNMRRTAGDVGPETRDVNGSCGTPINAAGMLPPADQNPTPPKPLEEP